MDYELDGQPFNWLEEKAKRNRRVHGVRFEEAAEALLDDSARIFFDEEHSTTREERYTAIGATFLGRIVRVTFREFEDETLHVISARLASSRERKRYEREG